MNKNINWGILGTSYISEVMANAIHKSATSQLLGIGSRSIATAKNFSQQFSIPKIYENYQDLLNDDGIDAVYIGLPNHLHKEWILRGLEAGKHILCEKPFVISISDAREVISHVRKSNLFCVEALMYQFHPYAEKIKEIIQNKIIGEVKLYNATYTAHIADIANPVAGGSIRNLGCYPISLVRLLADKEPIEIQGTGRFNHGNNTDNQASVILKFADDSVGVVSTADDIKMAWQFDVYGTKGVLKVVSNPWFPSDEDNTFHIYLNNETSPIEINVKSEKSLYTYQIDFVNSRIINKDVESFSEKSLMHSLGNTVVLETWLQQVKSKTKQPEYAV